MVGSAPTVLAAAVAAVTSRIRVGTGGVMLPNHQPLVVAEQFGVLESLYPGRLIRRCTRVLVRACACHLTY